jgi:transcriptional antiterminator NusG
MAKQVHSGQRGWYAVHTYSGYEDAVARNLKQRVESFGIGDKIFDVAVPSEKKVKIKGGKKTEIREKILHGYVLVDMIPTDDAWSVVRNTPQVTDDTVRIIDGPFKDLEGKVGEVDESRGKVRVMVPMFGRETPVELEADQVQRI